MLSNVIGINAFAVYPPSFSPLIPHLRTASWNLPLTVLLVVVGALCSFTGARVTSLFLPSKRLKQLFALLILLVNAYKIFPLLQ
ncbi:MAG: hypothetical protein H5U05_06880 [Candidatus Aminicenantes bacterium]|nr:hypothetical protein [Candidatus Aminicenantes bacterium]